MVGEARRSAIRSLPPPCMERCHVASCLYYEIIGDREGVLHSYSALFEAKNRFSYFLFLIIGASFCRRLDAPLFGNAGLKCLPSPPCFWPLSAYFPELGPPLEVAPRSVELVLSPLFDAKYTSIRIPHAEYTVVGPPSAVCLNLALPLWSRPFGLFG